MSHWREQIQQASFRGKLFNVDITTMEFGRRVNLHEYPFKDEPFAEDMGRKARTFTITALIDELTVPEQGYFQTRDELIEFIQNDESPGTLILPTLGKHVVRPTDCSVTFANSVGGMETLQLTFVEAGEVTFPQITINTKETTEIQKGLVDTTVIEEAGAVVNFEPKLSDSTEGVEDPDILVDETDLISDQFIETIGFALDIGEQATDELDAFVRILEDYSTGIREKLLNPTEYFTDTQSMLGDLRLVWSDNELSDAFDAFDLIFNTAVDDIGKAIAIFTPGRVQQNKNNQAVKDGFRNLVIGQMAVITVEQTFTSSNQVDARRELILNAFNQQIVNAGDSLDLLQRDALVDLRSATLEHLDNETGNLPDEIDFRIGDLTTVWTLANDLYGDADRGQEIVDANSIVNPNFVQGQSVVKVLTS